MRLEKEVAAVHQLDARMRYVVPEGFGTGRAEDLVILSPHCEYGDLSGAQPVVDRGVQPSIGCVVGEQVQLSAVDPRATK